MAFLVLLLILIILPSLTLLEEMPDLEEQQTRRQWAVVMRHLLMENLGRVEFCPGRELELGLQLRSDLSVLTGAQIPSLLGLVMPHLMVTIGTWSIATIWSPRLNVTKPNLFC